MGRDLSELASYFLPLAEDLLGKCDLAGIPCLIEDTGRTPSEQQMKLANGLSWTKLSKHLPQPPEGKSEAVDIVPKVIAGKNAPGWNPADPLWTQIGLIGESIGLFWGGRWTHLNGGTGDPGHFQYIHLPNNSEAVQDAAAGEN